MTKENSIKIVLIFISLIFILTGINYGLNIYDEAIAVEGAKRMIAGEAPYRDFWTLYAPGQFYFYSGIIKIFGSDILILRIISGLIYLAFAYAIYSIGQILYDSKKAIIPFLITVSLFGGISFYNRAVVTALMFFSFSLYYLLLYDRDKKINHLFYSGIMAALCVFFRHEFSVYILIVSIGYFVIEYIQQKKIKLKNISVFFSGFFLLTTIIYLYVMSVSGFDNMYEQLVSVPLSVFKDYRSTSLPIPFIGIESISSLFSPNKIFTIWESIMFYFPFLILLSLVFYFIKHKSFTIDKRFFLIGIIIFVLLNQGSTRSDFEHILPAIAFSSLLIPFFINKFRNKILIYCAVLSFIILPSIGAKLITINKSFALGGNQYLGVEYADNISIKENWQKDYKKTINYIKEKTRNDERIFVCTDRFDKILLNDIMIYVLADRLPAVKYHELHPGVATELPAQQEMVQSLIKSNNRLIIRELNTFSKENNKSAISSGVNVLDNFIEKNYEFTEQFGNYKIYWKKSSSEIDLNPAHNF